MKVNFFRFQKAAFKNAAFLFMGCFMFHYEKIDAAPISFQSLKQKCTGLILQKKKTQAIHEVIDYLANSGEQNKEEANDFLVLIAQQFVFREAQDAYESSINFSLDNVKEAIKNIDKCLSIEPQQLDCMIQKARLLYRVKETKGVVEVISQIKEIVPHSKFDRWLSLIMIKNKNEFKNKQIIKFGKDKTTDEWSGLVLLELERCFEVRNFSCAKDLLGFYEKNYADWPDLVFYKFKLDEESSEEKFGFQNEKNAEQFVLYKNKCKSISKTIARKYRYDFDLCMRSPK